MNQHGAERFTENRLLAAPPPADAEPPGEKSPPGVCAAGKNVR